MPAPTNGFLGSIEVKEGETVNVGSLLGTINNTTKMKNLKTEEIKKYNPPVKDQKKDQKFFDESNKNNAKNQKKLN